jgi:hypothetical protein
LIRISNSSCRPVSFSRFILFIDSRRSWNGTLALRFQVSGVRCQ